MKPVSCGMAMRSWLSSISRSSVVPEPMVPTMKIGPRFGAGVRALPSTAGRVYERPLIARGRRRTQPGLAAHVLPGLRWLRRPIVGGDSHRSLAGGPRGSLDRGGLRMKKHLLLGGTLALVAM